jgi:hypothetical protein
VAPNYKVYIFVSLNQDYRYPSINLHGKQGRKYELRALAVVSPMLRIRKKKQKMGNKLQTDFERKGSSHTLVTLKF